MKSLNILTVEDEINGVSDSERRLGQINHLPVRQHDKDQCQESCRVKWPLHFCAKEKDFDNFQKTLFQVQLENPNSLWSYDCNGQTVLHIICEQEYAETAVRMATAIFEWRVTIPTGFIDLLNAAGNAAIHLAAYNSCASVVKFLIQQGAKTNTTDSDGRLPFQLAAKSNEAVKHALETIELLLPHAGDIHAKASNGATALCECRSPQLVEFLLNNGLDYDDAYDPYDGFTPLHNAVYFADENDLADLECLGRVLEILSAEQINKQTKKEDCEYRYAFLLCSDAPKILNVFLNCSKVDIHVADNDNQTILHHAAKKSWSETTREVVEELLQSKRLQQGEERFKFLNMKTKDGKTALDVSIENDCVSVSSLLIQSYPDPKRRIDEDLMIKIYHKVPEIVLPLITVTKTTSSDGDIVEAELWPITGCHLDEEEDKNAAVFGSGALQCETDFISHILDSEDVKEQEQGAVLANPVVELFIFAKWEKIKWLFWITFTTQMLMLILHVAFIYDVYLISCPYNATTLPCDLNGVEEACGICLAASFMLRFISTNGIILLTLGFNYKKLLTFKNFVQFGLTLSVSATTVGSIIEGTVHWQYWMSAVSILFASILALFNIREIPSLGIYADVFFDVLIRLVFLMLAFSPLIIGFTFAISLILPGNRAFVTPLLGMAKVLMMMTGELNFDDVFHKEDSVTPFWSIGLFIFVLFTILVAIVMFNLLLGFTISDIKELQDTAETRLLVTTLEQIIILERVILSDGVQKMVPKKWLEKVLLATSISIPLEQHPVKMRTRLRELVKTKDVSKDK